MKRNILLPTDFSENAWSAAAYALKLYAHKTCTFYFLHAMKMKASSISNITNKLLETIAKNDRKKLLKLKEKVQNMNVNANHDFEIILSSDDLQDAIEFSVEKHYIDMVIMGTKGASGAKEIFLGSNTIHIVKKLRSCPILIVPSEFDFSIPKQIAFSTDFRQFYDDICLRPLKELASLYNSKIRIVHVNTEANLDEIQEYNIKRIKEYFKDCEHSFHWIPDYAKKVKQINDFIEEQGIDILVMLNYRHSFIEWVIKEPVIVKIGFHPKTPFLVVPY
jgi:nucleotide-binding universal stress UspA family protein